MTYLTSTFGTTQIESVAPDAGSLLPTVAGGAANTKGSFVEIVASTSFTYEGFVLTLTHNDFSPVPGLVDIAIGAAASEVVILPNIPLTDTGASAISSADIYIPMRIAKGERVSARCQFISAFDEMDVGISGFAKGMDFGPIYQNCISLGANTSTSLGVAIDITVANTKSAYVSLGTLPSGDINGIRAYFLSFGSGNDGFMADDRFFYDLAIGTASNEEVILHDYPQQSHNFEGDNPRHTEIIYQAIHSEEIRARCQSQQTTNDKHIYFHGFY